MNQNPLIKRIIITVTAIVLAGSGLIMYLGRSISIKSIQLSSPNNFAMEEEVKVALDKEAPVYVEYWKDSSDDKYKTALSKKGLEHSIILLLLEPNTTYHYRVIVDRWIDIPSEIFSFHTREQSPWLIHNWVKQENPHDASTLAGGMVMLCNARLPGYIAMVDGKGAIRWYWQLDDIGIRAATLTPRGTLLAMLRPPMKDVIDDTPKEEADSLRQMERGIRRGAMGFAGGTGIAEIGLDGKLMWRLNMDTAAGGKYPIIHHDIRMDKEGHIVTLVRTKKVIDLAEIGGNGIDTLVGDGILVMDTTGKEIKVWNVWDHWDIKNDPSIKEFAYDRFHFNALNFDKDGNYIVSVAIEDQIWKIDATTGKIIWKLGKGGNFKMDTANYFSFQHSVQINPYGDLMVFDNSLWKKRSGAISFSLDTVKWVATTKIHALLPRSKYTSRMGSAFILPNGYLLQCSSKTGTVMVTDEKGNILWELNSYFVPYRAEYIPAAIWDTWFTKE